MSTTSYPSPLYRIPANWEPCDAIALVWPHLPRCSDEILEFYEALASLVPDYANLIIIVRLGQTAYVTRQLEALGASTEFTYFHELDVADINIHKWGPAIVESSGDFLYFKQDVDQSPINSFFQQLFVCAKPFSSGFYVTPAVLETNGENQVLLNKREWTQLNPGSNLEDFICFLRESCGIKDLIVIDLPLELSHLPVRLCPHNRLVVTRCDDIENFRYGEFQKVNTELRQALALCSTTFDISYLPWVGDLQDSEGKNYLADYSQFLILNEAIFLPMFDLPTDEDAMEIMSELFPGFDVLGFPSSALALADTSLINIHLPIIEGVLEPLYE